jgi:catechol 2,3-dioxygenase-like lactoylglutathione lyase family enzyme
MPSLHATAFDHLTIICSDLEATRGFYVDFLGMAEVPRPAFSFPGKWFQLGSVQIHATQQSGEAGQAGWADRGTQIVPRGHHFAFAVDDVAQTLDAIAAHNVHIASPIQVRPDGYKQLFVYDPDGHLVELASK